jgi:hypothetical protein
MSTTQGYGWSSGGAPVPDVKADGSGLIDALAATFTGHGEGGDDGGGHGRYGGQPSWPRQAYRPADTLARALYPILYGAPLNWKDPNYLGIDWRSLTWSNLGWDTPAWDNLGWDNLGWDNLGWDNLGWDNLGWDNLGWDNLGWDNLGWDNLAWDNLGWDNLGWDNLGWDSGKLD